MFFVIKIIYICSVKIVTERTQPANIRLAVFLCPKQTPKIQTNGSASDLERLKPLPLRSVLTQDLGAEPFILSH